MTGDHPQERTPFSSTDPNPSSPDAGEEGGRRREGRKEGQGLALTSSHHPILPRTHSALTQNSFPQNSRFPKQREYPASPHKLCHLLRSHLACFFELENSACPQVLLCSPAWDRGGAGGVRSDPTTPCISPQKKFTHDAFCNAAASYCFHRKMYEGTNTWSRNFSDTLVSGHPLIHADVGPKDESGVTEKTASSLSDTVPGSQTIPPPD